MSVGEAFMLSGQVYVMGAGIALGMAVLIKVICVVIDRSDKKAAEKAAAASQERRAAE